jgi:hypothetical protein
MKRLLHRLLPLCVGLLAGVVGAKLVVHRAETSLSVRSDEQREPTRTALTAAFDSGRVATLEARLAAMEGDKGARDARPSPAADAVPFRSRSPEERDRHTAAIYSNHLQRIEEHQAAARDEVWATPMEARVANSFKAIPPEMKLSYEGTDCRTSSCEVKFSWPSRSSAEGDLRTVVTTLAITGCGREIALPPTKGGDEPTRGSLLLTCPRSAGL